jgi:hypothetical protein
MARKSIQELIAQATSSFPDNVTGLITPALLRTWATDFLKAIAPAYGVLQKSAFGTQLVGLTPSVMQWTTRQDSDPSQTTTSAAQGTIERAERGTSDINFSADFEAPVNRFVSFTLYKNGVATLWRVTGNGGGNGNPIGVSFAAKDYADPAATYDIRITAEIDGVSANIGNASLIVGVDPVNSYT